MDDNHEDADMLAGAIEHALALQRAADKALDDLGTAHAELSRIERSMPNAVQQGIERRLGNTTDAGC